MAAFVIFSQRFVIKLLVRNTLQYHKLTMLNRIFPSLQRLHCLMFPCFDALFSIFFGLFTLISNFFLYRSCHLSYAC